MLKKYLFILTLITIILTSTELEKIKKKNLIQMLDKMTGCNPSTESSKKLEENIELSLYKECKILLECALSKEKHKNKDFCLDQFHDIMKEVCLAKIKKLGGTEKEKVFCDVLILTNNAYTNLISHEYFLNAKRKYEGIIKYYEYPSFKDSFSNDKLECYLGNTMKTKGVGDQCREKKNIYTFYLLPNGKYVIENAIGNHKYSLNTFCIIGKENPLFEFCDFEDKEQQYHVRFIKEGKNCEDKAEELFIENFGEFVEVIVTKEYDDNSYELSY